MITIAIVIARVNRIAFKKAKEACEKNATHYEPEWEAAEQMSWESTDGAVNHLALLNNFSPKMKTIVPEKTRDILRFSNCSCKHPTTNKYIQSESIKRC